MTSYEDFIEYIEECGKKDYQVKYSGHGSKHRFDGNDPDKPTLPNVTLIEAYMKGRWWVRHVETIGGDAQIYNVPANETLNLDQAKEVLEGDISNYGLHAVALPLLEKVTSLENIIADIKTKLKKIAL